MKKYLLLAFTLLFTEYSSAEVRGFFNENNATIVIQGPNNDFKNFYASIIADELESNGIVKKSFALKSNSNELIFSIECAKTSQVDSGSCTLIFNTWYYSPVVISIDKNSENLSMTSQDKWSAKILAKNFADPSQQGVIFSSEDSKLWVTATKDTQGVINNLKINFTN